MHAPKIPYGNNNETKKVFAAIDIVRNECELCHVVVHPDTIEDFSVFEDASFNIVFENMDCFKKAYTTPEEMRDLLERFPSANMVLDVNHVYTHDSTMALAKEFYKQCGNRIVELHVSGFEELHDPLYRTKQKEILEAIQDTSIPMIIESWMKPEEVEREVAYIRSVLESKA